MKVRIRFSQKGNMKFIGHLDTMRYFQKTIRRAGIDASFSEGFNPHMIMSFAAPLGIGVTSDAEYMDLDLKTPISSKEAIDALNKAGSDGIVVTGFVRIPDEKSSNAMALISAADYTIRFRSGHEPDFDWKSGIPDFFSQKSITVLKKTKHSEKETDIRPMIYEWSLLESVSGPTQLPKDEADGSALFLKLAAGSAANLKPEFVMDTYLEKYCVTPDPLAYEVNRCEMYADLGQDGERKLVSLYDLGEEI